MRCSPVRRLISRIEQPLDAVHPPDLRPLLHADHSLLLASIRSDRARLEAGRTLPPPRQVGHFSTGEGGQYSGGAYKGKTAGEAAKALEVSEQTLHRWRNQYGGMKADDAKRLKELERRTRG